MQNNITAFTIIQMLISLSIIGLLLSVSIPSYQHFAAKQEAELAKQQLLRAINFARSQAIYQQRESVLVGAPQWTDGYEVKLGSKVIKKFLRIKNTGEISWRSFPLKNYLVFNAQGFTAYQNGTFTYVSKDQKFHWKLIVNQSGRVRVA